MPRYNNYYSITIKSYRKRRIKSSNSSLSKGVHGRKMNSQKNGKNQYNYLLQRKPTPEFEIITEQLPSFHSQSKAY